jgi:hypothetical protein
VSTEIADSLAHLTSLTDEYVDRARNATRDELRAYADAHAVWADRAEQAGDVHAVLLHSRLQAMFLAHVLADLAAEVIAAGGPDPRDRPNGGAR